MISNSKSLLFCILFLSVFSMDSEAQDEELGVIFWSKDRDLDWDDFKGKSFVDTLDNFYMDLYIQSTYASEVDSYILVGNKPEAYMFTNTSYVDKDIRNEDLLRYLNAYFDLSGYYAFKLTKGATDAKESKNTTIRGNPNIISKSIVEEWKSECTRLAIETEYGQVIERLLQWEEDIANKVETIKQARLEVSDYSFGMDFLGGGLLALEDYSNYLSNTAVGHLSAEVTKAPLVFAIGFSGGGQTVLQSFSNASNIYPIDSKPNIMNTFLHLGYKIFDNNSFRIIPRLGIHFSRLTYSNDSQNESTDWSTNLTAGFTIDYKLWKWSAAKYDSRSLTDISIRFGTYYYPMSAGETNLSHGIISGGISMTIGGGKLVYDR